MQHKPIYMTQQKADILSTAHNRLVG